MTAIFFTAIVAIAAACKGDPDPAKPLPLPPFVPPEFDASDPAAAKRSVNADGWLLVDPGGEDGALVVQAVTTLQARNGSQVGGTVTFGATDEGVRAKLALHGLSFLSKYTVRVHMLGDCSAEDGSSAGPSFNFDGSSLSPADPAAAGVLGVIQADVSGEAKGETAIAGPAIQGPYSILGRSLVLHAQGESLVKADDGLGPRLACGVIGVFADVGPAPVLGDR